MGPPTEQSANLQKLPCFPQHGWGIPVQGSRAGLSWPLDPDLDDSSGETCSTPGAMSRRPSRMPDMAYLHRELKRKSVTLQLLWYEYKESPPRRVSVQPVLQSLPPVGKKLDVTLRQDHRAGEKPSWTMPGRPSRSSTPPPVRSRGHIFIAALGASSYTFAEAPAPRIFPPGFRSHIHAFEFFRGVARSSCRTTSKRGLPAPAVTSPTSIPPIRTWPSTMAPRSSLHGANPETKPRSNRPCSWPNAGSWPRSGITPSSALAELNKAIAGKLLELNKRRFKKLDATRRELYERPINRPSKPFPPTPYEFAEWKKARVNIDYHVEVDRHYYTVPYQLARSRSMSA